MHSTVTILIGAAAAAVLAVMAATSLKPADGSFAGGPDLAPTKRLRSDDVTAVTIPSQRDRRPPDYVVGTDSVARDRLAWQGIEAASEPQENPSTAADPTPEPQRSLPLEPAPAEPADDLAR